MKKLFFLIITLASLGLGCNVANAASTVEEALGDVDIHCDGTTMNYLVAGRGVQNLKYAYYEYYSDFTGETKEIPAYCVNPNDPGAGQVGSYTVNCASLASDPKLVGIISNGYPRQSFTSLGLKDKYEAYYSTKIALWCYLINSWDINAVKVNANCADQEAATRVLNAARKIYNNGVTWTETIQPTLTATPLTSTVIEDKVDSDYLSQEFIVKANTYLPNGAIAVMFAEPDEVPDGVKIVDSQNNKITQFPVNQDGNYLSGKFKVLYPKDMDEEEISQVQINLQALQYRYVVYYGISYDPEKQDYLCDTDPAYISMASVTSSFAPQAELDEGTWLTIKKYETGTNIPLEGAVFEVIGPDGETVGRFTTTGAGEINIPLSITGNFTVKEISSSKNHLIGDNSTQNVTVRYNETAEVTFYNDAYGILEIEKIDGDNGNKLSGAVIQAKNITTGRIYTMTTGASGIARLEAVIGAWEITEKTSPNGYLKTNEVVTVNVESGRTSKVTLKNTSTPSLRIIKMDKINNIPLPNVFFEVYCDTEYVGTYETGEMGEILISNLEKEGTYLVKEISNGNPSYVVDSYPQEVEVKAGKTAELVFFNLKKSGINLLKVDSQSYEPISQVIFSIKQIGGDFFEERITSEEGIISLSDLEPGSYEIVEKSNGLNGYVIDDGVRVVKIEAGEPDALFVFTNTKKPSLNIIKVSAKGEPIPNAVFSVAQIGKTPVEYKTNAQGVIYLEGLEPAVVSVVEKSVNDNYILDPTEYIIELFPGKTSQLVVVNDEKPKLKILKTDAVSGKPVPGTKFKVSKADNSTIGIFTTDENGEVLIDKLDEGVVEIIEVYVPETHILSDIPQSVTLVRNKTSVVQFENQPRASLKIIKTDKISNSFLENTVFEIIRKDDDGETSLGEFYTDENGEILIENIPFPTRLKIIERKASPGYKALEEEKEVLITKHENRVVKFTNDALSPLYIKKIDSKTREPVANARFRVTKMNGEFVYEGNTDIYGFICIPELEPTWYTVTELSVEGYVLDQLPKNIEVKLGEPAIVEFYNSPYGNLVIQKVDNEGNALEGVQFRITTVDGQNVGNGLYETDSDGFIRLSSIEPKFYMVKEEKTLDTHILDETERTVEVKSGETYTLKVVNDIKSGLIIKKTIKGTGEPLANCKFAIREIDGTNVGTYKTNKSGTIFVSLSPNWYQVQELSCPEGFAIDSEVKLVEVTTNEPTILEVENEQMSGIRIKKICSESGEGLYGVRFLIKDNKNNIVGCYTTDQDGYVDLTYELSAGKYYLEEISTKKGYVLDTEVKTIRVREGRTEEIIWENQPEKGQIQIIKKSAEYNAITKLPAGSLLAGSIFEIYNERNNRIVDRIISDERGIAASKPLPVGERYLIYEVESSPYYQVNPTPIKAEIKVNGDIVMFEVFNNNAKLGVSVKKVGNLEVQSGTQMRYDISNIANNSNVPLDNFYMHDRIPTDAVRLDKIITGIYNERFDYSIYYKTNYRDYSLLVGDIASYINHEIICTESALGLMAGEYITDIKFEYGTVQAGFRETTMPMLFVTVLPNIQNDYKIINNIDVAGKYLNEWQIATDVWLTNVYSRAKQKKLPVTGY